MVSPSSRFSNTAETGMRVPRKTHAPLTFPGTLSTAGHCDQSSAITCLLDYPSEAQCGTQHSYPPRACDDLHPSVGLFAFFAAHDAFVNGLAALKAFLLAVPELDLFFAEFPA